MQMFYKLCAKQVKPEPSIQEQMQEEANLLYADTVRRELQLIDDKYKISANNAKAKYLLEQITQPTVTVEMPSLPDDFIKP